MSTSDIDEVARHRATLERVDHAHARADRDSANGSPAP